MLSNYPDSLNDHSVDVPWNDSDVPEKDFEITCSQSLSRTATVRTNNYIPGASGCDYEPDGEGGYCACGWHDPDDTSNTNWANEYHSNDLHTPLQLIQLLKQVLETDMEHGIVFKSPRFTQDLINECDDWTEDETEYVEN